VHPQVDQAGKDKVLNPRYNDRVSVNLEKRKDPHQAAMAATYIDRTSASSCRELVRMCSTLLRLHVARPLQGLRLRGPLRNESKS
jgi:hypothetical protein